MAAVDLGDGNSMELGENPSPELLARVKTVIETNKAKASPGNGIWEQAKSLGADFIRGAGRSLAGLAEGAAAFNSTERPSFKKSEAGQTVVGPSGDTPPVLTEAVNKALPVPPGAGTARQYVRAGLEGLGGGVATGGVSPTVMASGLVGGLGGEAGQRLAGEPGKLLGTIAGGVVGGGAVAAANMVRPQTAAVAKEAMEGFTEAELRSAQAFKNKQMDAGFEMDLAQALAAVTGREGNLAQIRNVLANRSAGNEVQRVLINQPAAVQREGQITLAGLPGRDQITTTQAANNLQETATQAIGAARKQRSALWNETVQDGVAALRASESVNVTQAADFAKQTGMTLAAARGQVKTLLTELEKAKAGDMAAVTGANTALTAKMEKAQQAIEALKTFSLPRGTTATNAGSFSTLPQRGQSIMNDSITREVQASRVPVPNLPPVAFAPSTQTMGLEKQLTAAQLAEAAAAKGNTQALAGVDAAKVKMNAASVIPPQVLAKADGMLQSKIAGQAPGSVVAQELATLRSNLLGRDGKMLTDPQQINDILKQFTTRLKSPDLKTAGVDAGVSKYLGGVVTEMRDQLGAGFIPIKNANTAFKEFTDTTLNPLKQGPVGTIAQPKGFTPDTQAMVSKFDGLLHTGTPAGVKQSDLRTVVKELGKVDKTAVEDSFKNWVSRQMGKSMDTPITPGAPSTNADMAKRLHEGLFKDSARWQGIKDVVAEMAVQRGQKPEEVIRGLENYRQLLNAARSRPRSMEGLSADDLKQLGGSSNFANAVRVFSFLPANRLGEAIERNVLGKTFSEFDTILTSREGADRLIKLGKVPIVSTGAKIMFGTLGAGLGNPSGLSQNNPPE